MRTSSDSDFCSKLLEIEPEVLTMALPEGDWTESAGNGRPPIQKIWMERMAEVADRALTTTVQWAKKVPGKLQLVLYSTTLLNTSSTRKLWTCLVTTLAGFIFIYGTEYPCAAWEILTEP